MKYFPEETYKTQRANHGFKLDSFIEHSLITSMLVQSLLMNYTITMLIKLLRKQTTLSTII